MMNLSLYDIHELYKLENESGIFCGAISVCRSKHENRASLNRLAWVFFSLSYFFFHENFNTTSTVDTVLREIPYLLRAASNTKVSFSRSFSCIWLHYMQCTEEELTHFIFFGVKDPITVSFSSRLPLCSSMWEEEKRDVIMYIQRYTYTYISRINEPTWGHEILMHNCVFLREYTLLCSRRSQNFRATFKLYNTLQENFEMKFHLSATTNGAVRRKRC